MASSLFDCLSYKEKIERFKDICADDLSQNIVTYNPQLFYPLEIRNCNGTGPWSFTDATLDYEKKAAFPVLLWYKCRFMDFARELQNMDVFHEENKPGIECLLDSVISDKHMDCLRSLLSAAGGHREAQLKTILAIHYFQPLVRRSKYTIADMGSLSNCELCKEKDIRGDTSFGHEDVWHGFADIVIQRSVIKVGNEMEEKDVEKEDYSAGEPMLKKIKTEVEIDSNEAKLNSRRHDIEYALGKTQKRKRKCQALAQAIVNAYCESKKDKSLLKMFIPSFYATQKNIRIILYNCELDILLLSKKFPIWKTGSKPSQPKLNTVTLVHVWLALNFPVVDKDIPDYVLRNTQSSNFKNVVKDVYSVYLNTVTSPMMPCLALSKTKTSSSPEPLTILKVYKDCCSVHAELVKCLK